MSTHGWVKLWRKTEDSAVFADPNLLKLFILCLLMANHKEIWLTVHGLAEPVRILAGQFITGRYALHKAYYPRKKKHNASPSTLWRWLQTLENMGNVHIHTNSRYSLITICKWECYQGAPDENEQPKMALREIEQPNSPCTAKNEKQNATKKGKSEHSIARASGAVTLGHPKAWVGGGNDYGQRVEQPVEQPVNSRRTAEGQKVRTNKKDKKDKKVKKTTPAPATPPPYAELRCSWNEMAKANDLPTVREMTEKRKVAVRARWRANGWRKDWVKALAVIPNHPFLLGENDRGWRANIDWFLRPNSVTSLLEGKYQGGEANARATDEDHEKGWGHGIDL